MHKSMLLFESVGVQISHLVQNTQEEILRTKEAVHHVHEKNLTIINNDNEKIIEKAP